MLYKITKNPVYFEIEIFRGLRHASLITYNHDNQELTVMFEELAGVDVLYDNTHELVPTGSITWKAPEGTEMASISAREVGEWLLIALDPLKKRKGIQTLHAVEVF